MGLRFNGGLGLRAIVRISLRAGLGLGLTLPLGDVLTTCEVETCEVAGQAASVGLLGLGLGLGWGVGGSDPVNTLDVGLG